MPRIFALEAFVVWSASFSFGSFAAAAPKPSGTCKTVQPCVTALRKWTDSPSYCSSLISITPTTMTVTLAGTTTTVVQPVLTITADASTTSTITTTTITVCSHEDLVKRAAASTKTKPSSIPPQLKTCKTSNIPRACSCLALPTNTITKTEYRDKTVTSGPSDVTSTFTPAVVTITSTSTTTHTVGGTSVPTAILKSPVPITERDANGDSPRLFDDSVIYLPDLPFNVSLFGTSTSTVAITIDGWIALVTDRSVIPTDAGWVNRGIPAPNDGSTSSLPDVVFIPYWNELDAHQGRPQGVSYQITGSETGSRELSIEWIVSQYFDETAYYHFAATLYEGIPGAVTFSYYQMAPGPNQYPDSLRYGTVGVQKFSEGKFAQYSFDQPIAAGMRLFYDPDMNEFQDRSMVQCPTRS